MEGKTYTYGCIVLSTYMFEYTSAIHVVLLAVPPLPSVPASVLVFTRMKKAGMKLRLMVIGPGSPGASYGLLF